ncbi:unnamed protein product [Miscanthus lutarioriparius]|uniref:threonine--tRNA ligase n=1 Tax=Miscanthus lutarioriparius TaxID=422564 RepID=A0A811MEI9_9POAL|nr:unnamed protein product [Miscanthus lutarioriparius]
MGEGSAPGKDAKGKGKAKAPAPASALVARDDSYLEAVTQKRIRLFEEIQARQAVERLNIGGEVIKITLPDGAIKEGKKWITTPMDIAKEISSGFAASCLIAQVDEKLWDMGRPLEGDCKLQMFKFDTNEGRDTFWYSSAHILGEGFYYDAYYNDLTLNEEHFGVIENQAKKAVAEKQPFERIEVSRAEALEMFAENKFKVEIINELPEDKTITVYRCGPLVDLCRGPHIPNTSFVKAFACLKASSLYWRGKADRESLQRVYGISFPDSRRLTEYKHFLEEAKKRDHRILGKAQELFFFHELSPGSCFFLPHGARIYNKLMDFMRQQYRDRGYQEVLSPNIYNMQLWETSGHAANYKENMFVFEIEKQEFGLKPMNCPGHCLMFRVRSYRELPLRMADFGVLHRNELSGALTGLTRVRRFQQDDAHIFCREDQRPEKYLGEIETWNKAEQQLTEALNEFGKPWKLDFQLPIRFKLTYSAEDEAKIERPVMIHRAILGSVERMFAILLEHYNGKWPLWLSPRQAIVCSVSSGSVEYAKQVLATLHETGFHVDIDVSDRTIQKMVREAQVAQFNYILVVGAQEAETGNVCVRVRDNADLATMSVDSLITRFREEIGAFR